MEAMEYKDYYKMLEVPRTATPDEIKKAYRRLARKYHPDVSQLSDAEERFKEINEAYEVLGDPQKRQEYEQLGKHWKSGQEFRPPPGWRPQNSGRPGGGFEFSEFFENLFGGARRRSTGATGAGSPWTGTEKPEDLVVETELSLEQAIAGTEVTFEQAGTVQRFRIPPGAQDGTRLRVRGKGTVSPVRGTRGDIVIEIRIRPDSRYRLEGRDLHRDIPITPWEAALGASIEVPTPTGMIKLKVPSGSQSGKIMRLKGKGLPGKNPGDLLLHLLIAIPPLEEARDWYEKMARESQFQPRAGLKN